MVKNHSHNLILGWFIALSTLAALSIGGWLTHIITCLIAGKWGFLIAGAILFPIAIIHGWLIWAGVA